MAFVARIVFVFRFNGIEEDVRFLDADFVGFQFGAHVILSASALLAFVTMQVGLVMACRS